jgi:hypothetical protein
MNLILSASKPLHQSLLLLESFIRITNISVHFPCTFPSGSGLAFGEHDLSQATLALPEITLGRPAIGLV